MSDRKNSSVLSGHEYRSINTLSHECRDRGDDPYAWRMHLGEHLNRKIGAGLVFAPELGGSPSGAPLSLGVAEWGWHQGYDPRGWEHATELFKKDPHYSAPLRAYFGKLIGQPDATYSRTDLISEAEWRASPDCDQVNAVIGVDHVAYSFHMISHAAPTYAGLICSKGVGERDFTVREKAYLAEAHRTVAALVGTHLARFHEPSAADLTPRLRDVLRCLLEGDSDKQAASRLRIGRHTVNQYAKAIFKHFGVQSRPELLARWIRRGWGSAQDF